MIDSYCTYGHLFLLAEPIQFLAKSNRCPSLRHKILAVNGDVPDSDSNSSSAYRHLVAKIGTVMVMQLHERILETLEASRCNVVLSVLSANYRRESSGKQKQNRACSRLHIQTLNDIFSIKELKENSKMGVSNVYKVDKYKFWQARRDANLASDES